MGPHGRQGNGSAVVGARRLEGRERPELRLGCLLSLLSLLSLLLSLRGLRLDGFGRLGRRVLWPALAPLLQNIVMGRRSLRRGLRRIPRLPRLPPRPRDSDNRSDLLWVLILHR